MARTTRYIGAAIAAFALAGIGAGTAQAAAVPDQNTATPAVASKPEVGPATVQLRGPYDDFRSCIYGQRAAVGAGERIHWSCFQGVEGKWWFAVVF